jgi:ubiquitin-like protein ATG12
MATPAAGVKVQFKAVGNAPLLKKTKFRVPGSETFAGLAKVLRQLLGCAPSEELHMYISSSFAPLPDQLLSDLFDCFGTEAEGELIVSYSTTAAYG